jgi:23S rRNA pseudouridine1911/1915/1917 synthase
MKIIYEDKDLLVVDKPAGIIVFHETQNMKHETTVIGELIKEKPELAEVGSPPRYGVVHRLDKDTSGVLLVAKNNEALNFLQKQYINREVEKKYICLVEGVLDNDSGEIKTLIARAKGDPRKQRVYTEINAPKSAREAVTEYKVLKRYQDYTLLEVQIKTGRRHQIRCHLAYLKHPVAGDKMYAFKNSKIPDGLTRQFLHSEYLKIKLPWPGRPWPGRPWPGRPWPGRPDSSIKEFKSNLPEDLQKVLDKLEK